MRLCVTRSAQPADGTSVWLMSRTMFTQRLAISICWSEWGREVLGPSGARDRQLGRIVAVKLPHDTRMSAMEADRFMREARAAAQLKHPAIAAVLEAGRESGQVYIVSEFIAGQDLAERMKVESLSARSSRIVCRDCRCTRACAPVWRDPPGPEALEHYLGLRRPTPHPGFRTGQTRGGRHQYHARREGAGNSSLYVARASGGALTRLMRGPISTRWGSSCLNC